MQPTKLAKIISTPLIEVAHDAPVALAAQIMSQKYIRHLPVMKSSKLVGIISDRDIQRAARVDVLPWGDATIQEKFFSDKHRVSDFMSSPAVCADIGDSVAKVAQLMVDRRISSVVILKGAAPYGIVSSNDLLKLLMGSPQEKIVDVTWPLSRWAIDVRNSPFLSVVDELSLSGI